MARCPKPKKIRDVDKCSYCNIPKHDVSICRKKITETNMRTQEKLQKKPRVARRNAQKKKRTKPPGGRYK